MKKVIIKSLLCVAGLTMVVACNKTPGQGGTPVGPASQVTDEEFNALKDKVLVDHNYTADIEAKYEDGEYAMKNYFIKNVSDDVIYWPDTRYMDEAGNYYVREGYIKKLNQGIAYFQGSEQAVVFVDELVTTNTSLGVSAVYPLAIENILDATFVRDTENIDQFVSSDMDPIVIAGNIALGEYIQYASAPESFSVEVNENKDALIINFDYIYNYVDESAEGSAFESFRQIKLNINILVHDLGTSHNAAYEEFIANSGEDVEDPEQWSEADLSVFNKYFNHRVGPFCDKLTYSYAVKPEYDGYNQRNYVVVDDINSGDISEDYGRVLENNGYQKQEDGTYLITTTDEELFFTHKYACFFVFTPQEEIDEEIRDLYPNGIFAAKFYHYKEMSTPVNSIALFNQYIASSVAKNVVPTFPDDGTVTKITGFNEKHEFINENSESGFVALAMPGRASYMRFYIDGYENAVYYLRTLIELFNQKGIVGEKPIDQMSSFMYFLTDDKDSATVITFANLISMGAANYPGYLQLQIVIGVNSIPEEGDIVLESLRLQGQQTVFTEGDEFVFGGTITAVYSNRSTKSLNVSDVTFSPVDMNTPGTKEVIVSYEENGVTVSEKYTIEVEEKIGEAHTISFIFVDEDLNPIEGEVANLTQSTLPNEGNANAVIEVKIVLNRGFELVESLPKGEDSPLWSQVDSDWASSSFSFKMPHADVEIYIKVKEVDPTERYEVNFANNLNVTGRVTMPSSVTEYEAGTTIQFAIDNPDNLDFHLTVTYGPDETPVDYSGPNFAGYYSFTMPEGNVLITIGTIYTVEAINPKTEYKVNDAFVNPTVKVTYTDQYEMNVTNATFSGYDMTTTGYQTVTVSYKGHTSTYRIHVSDSGEPEDQGAVELLNGDYKFFIANSNVTLVLSFDGEGNGSYCYINAYGVEKYLIEFTYAVDANTKAVTITLNNGVTKADINNYNNGYRIVDGNDQFVNDSGRILSNGNLSIRLYKMSAGAYIQNEDATIFEKQ